MCHGCKCILVVVAQDSFVIGLEELIVLDDLSFMLLFNFTVESAELQSCGK
jgi:hypothetical protein